MLETFVLHDGSMVDIRFEHKMFRADIDGVHYCAQDLDSLTGVISRFKSAVIPEVEPEPLKPLSELLYLKLKNGKLEEKQAARKELLNLVNSGDMTAVQYLDKLPVTPVSREARYVARILGKSEFEEVTFYDLSANVPDLVLRAKLMSELESRFKLVTN